MIPTLRLGAVILALLAAGCNGIATSPGMGPSTLPAPAPVVTPPPAAPPPGPHFALEIQGMPTATDVEPWSGLVVVAANPSIIRPELPARVVTTCGSITQTHALGSGSAPVRCLLPVGVHVIGAVAEMADGRRYPTAIRVTVGRPVEQPLTVYYDYLVESVAGEGNKVAFSVRTVDRATTYRWDFGDGGSGTTMLPYTRHHYSHGSQERRVTVRAMDGDLTLATGSVVGQW